jgi:hypothetical protein
MLRPQELNYKEVFYFKINEFKTQFLMESKIITRTLKNLQGILDPPS